MRLKVALSILLLSFASLCPAQQHRNRALLVGVANYPKGSGWDTIHSDNDVELLKGVLSETFTVKTLVDEQATRGKITSALTKLGKDTRKGDTVLILFSCHGQQMWQSDESDSLDEALVPYDAKRVYSDTYKGENHLRDNELAEYVMGIREKAGTDGLVVVLLDACHSGDSFRGDKFVRGVYDVFGLGEAPRIKRERNDVAGIGSEDGASDVLYISACQSYEINSEYRASDGRWYGSLAHAFAESYNGKGLTDVDLLNGIRKRLRKTSSQCLEFATSDTVLAEELRNAIEAVPPAASDKDDGDGGNKCKFPWMPLASALAAAVLTTFLFIKRNERRKRR